MDFNLILRNLAKQPINQPKLDIMRTLTVMFFLITQLTFSQNNDVKVEGVLKKMAKNNLKFKGDTFSESQEDNPFLNYRLNVVFKNKKKTYNVPGFMLQMVMLPKQALRKERFGKFDLLQMKLAHGLTRCLLEKENI